MGQGDLDAARRCTACESISGPSPATFTVPSKRRKWCSTASGIDLVQQLHARVGPSGVGTTGMREVPGERRVERRADELGEPRHDDPDVGTPAVEAAHVPLDLEASWRAAGGQARLMSSVKTAGSRGAEP